jgi:hypothetical protein
VTAVQEGWKKCARCRIYVQQNRGCNHITSHVCALTSFAISAPARGSPPGHEPEPVSVSSGTTTTSSTRERDACGYKRMSEAELSKSMSGKTFSGTSELKSAPALSDLNHRSKTTLQYREFRRCNRNREWDHCDHSLPMYAYECVECNLLFCKVCRFNRRLT